jgi:hypothetical protein
VLSYRHTRLDQTIGRTRKRKKTVFGQPNNRFIGQARHRGGAPHHSQIPRITQHSPGQLKKNPINPLPFSKEFKHASPAAFFKNPAKKGSLTLAHQPANGVN